MIPYQYKPLDLDSREIRLVELHPSVPDDPIQISISSASFVFSEQKSIPEYHLDRIQETLPTDWYVHETLEGQLLYVDGTSYPDIRTSWNHPDPMFDIAPYVIGHSALGSAQPAFEALSYTWGPDQGHVTIEVLPSWTGKNRVRRTPEGKVGFSVRHMLHEALKHLRDAANIRTLWIDAICINQEDMQERSQQVSRMGDIYKHARRVVVWLGSASTDSSLAMRTLRHIGEQVEYLKTPVRLPAPNCTESSWWRATDASTLQASPETWHAVYNLISRAWFERLWVRRPILRNEARYTLT
jgi:hypothetical protein